MSKSATPKQFAITVATTIIGFSVLYWFSQSDLLKKSTESIFSTLGGVSQRDNVIKNWQKKIIESDR